MKIAILGAGIGGLSSAIALKLAGFDVEVYERHSTVLGIGAGIVCWPNASFVLEQFGVLTAVMQVSGRLNNMNRFNQDGQQLGSLDINKLNELMGYVSYSIIRKDLMQILTQRLLELHINIHYQHKVIALSDSDTGRVTVSFDNGKSIQPDIVIGADGRMNSITRNYVNADNLPVYQGFINWIGVFESSDKIFNDISVADYWGVGERFGIVPVSSHKAYWAGGIVEEKIGDRNSTNYKDELTAIFNHWPTPIANIINNTPISSINKLYIHDHNPIKNWHKNNALLIGDAAHAALPTSGQGACQALEDAWHLANSLKAHAENISLAFDHFTQLRLDKTTGITMGGRQLAAAIFNRDAEFCQQRNLDAKANNYQNLVMGMAKIWGSGLL
ncbi:FAD-dependent monooxygenase [Colwellia psychrerythraea]|uniref:Monooxygenase FAD-binding protein n=1 Tax=Colwellia psychrerythraea TaxID=28229 RepID=A0A099L3L6_COLPS|nr:FAD-dependent monooxygenase [Colwellia psychrerythraea]KGJ97539.1 monooxygenase FAD-binding protein [Colwellia psychrerythraea]